MLRTGKYLASVARSKGSCECCEELRLLRVLRAAKILASVASSKGSCECCEQKRFL